MIQLILALALVGVLISCKGGSRAGTPDPEITGIQPQQGPPGTSVTISGSGFSPKTSDNTVTFDRTEAQVSSASDSELQAIVPDEATTGPVQVSVGQATVSGPTFTVEALAPGITSIQPDSGVVGTEVTITGVNFSSTAPENTVSFNGTTATVKSAGGTELVTEVPEGATDGPVEVTVNGEATKGLNFNVITTGTLRFSVTTGGKSKDEDGYSLVMDGDATKAVDTTDTVYFNFLEQGSHEAELSGLADNCTVMGDDLQTFEIVAGDTISLDVEIDCKLILRNKIVFGQNVSGNQNVYVMNADGTDINQLTNQGSNNNPVISHDGTRIAFYSTREGYPGDLYIMDADGTNMTRVTHLSEHLDYFSWSPDDSKVLIGKSINGNRKVYLVNTDGSDLKQMTDSGVTGRHPDWSPIKDRIVIASGIAGGDDEIFTMNLDGSEVVQITSSAGSNYGPRYSPDGTKIAFTSTRDGNPEIYIVNTDGSDLHRLTTDPDWDRFPAWSPDGSELLFESKRRDGTSFEIYKVKADGTGTPVRLTSGGGYSRPFWSLIE